MYWFIVIAIHMSTSDFNHRLKVGVTLGAGGARGFAHVGVIKSLVKHKIPINLISGSSMGSVIAAGYAKSLDIYKVEKLINDYTYNHFIRAKHRLIFLNQEELLEFFDKVIGKNQEFSDLHIPTYISVTNFTDLRSTTLDSGNVNNAILASISLPLINKAVKIGKKYYTDGGVTCNLPVSILEEKGANIIICSDVNSVLTVSEEHLLHEIGRMKSKIVTRLPSSRFLLLKELYLLTDLVSKLKTKEIDRLNLSRLSVPYIYVNIPLGDIQSTDFHRYKEAMELGEAAMDSHIHNVQDLLKQVTH